jgi:hypothetical protein
MVPGFNFGDLTRFFKLLTKVKSFSVIKMAGFTSSRKFLVKFKKYVGHYKIKFGTFVDSKSLLTF